MMNKSSKSCAKAASKVTTLEHSTGCQSYQQYQNDQFQPLINLLGIFYVRGLNSLLEF